MAYYQELSVIIDNVIGEKILRNQNICKLLYYYPTISDNEKEKYPYLDYPVYSQPDIEDTSILFLTHVYPMPKMPDVKTKQKTYVCVNVSGGYEADKNKGFRRVNLLVDIICHLDAWKVREGYRPYLIMNEVDKMLNNKVTDLPIENNPYSRGFQPRDYSNYYYGIQMLYELNVNSNIVCTPYSPYSNIGRNEPDVPPFIQPYDFKRK